MSTKAKKEKVNIMGKKYKVEKPISDTLRGMSEALHSHEVALLTWVHKDYTSEGKFEKEDVNGFRESLYQYCMNIPEAENILKRMQELDDQLEKDKKEQNKKEKEEEIQNKQEKDSGAKE
tara:strand:- start:34 stop:393 length:360 start_codon:yes stop_codon:yes gene_type:complete